MSSNYVIGDHFRSFSKSHIRQGRYASASEVIRSLRAEIQKGADSGEGMQASGRGDEPRLRGHPNNRIDELLPHRWVPST